MTVRRPQKSEHGDAAEAPGQAYKNDIGSTAPTKKHNYQRKKVKHMNKLQLIDADTLYYKPLAHPKMLIDGVLSDGLAILAGDSKIGKSWMVLWLCLQISRGEAVWGLPTRKTDVVYLALEDREWRVQQRMQELTEGAKHVLGWKSPHYVYHCNQAPSLKLLLRDFKLSDDIGLRFSNSEWPEYPLFADKYINWIDALPQEEQVINIFMELSALGMAQPLSSNILEFLKALPECAKSKGITFSTPTEIVSKLKSVSQLDVPYPMSWVDEERDTSSWLGNILQREAFNKLYSVAERVHLCDDRRIKQDWDYLQASNNFRFMTTKNTGIWLNRGIYDSPYDAFTNYMNILGDFIKRVDSLYPVDVDNEELNSLLTTIKNQGEEIAELQKEVTKWQAKAEKGAVKAPKKVAAKKEPVAKATRKKATAKKEE